MEARIGDPDIVCAPGSEEAKQRDDERENVQRAVQDAHRRAIPVLEHAPHHCAYIKHFRFFVDLLAQDFGRTLW